MTDEWRERLVAAEKRRQELLRDSEEARRELGNLIKQAREEGIPMSHIAGELGLNRKVTYHLLSLADSEEPPWRPLR